MFEEELIKNIERKINGQTLMYSPAQLAYAGDAVYELLVRSYLLKEHDYNVNQMHKNAVKFVKAKAQSQFVKDLDDILTEEEKKIIKRGRNAKVTSSPKNADLMDYRYATGFEAMFGYLYLNGENERLVFLFDKCIQITKEKDGTNEDNRGKKPCNRSTE